MVAHTSVRIRPYGDSGLLVMCEGDDRDARWRLAQHVGRRLEQQAPTGMTDLVASFETVFISYDPLVATQEDFEQCVLEACRAASPVPEARTFHVPVVYGGELGPELDAVAGLLGLSADALVELHVSTPWTVRLVASPAGAPLMDGPRVPRSVPRLSSPRMRVAAGSVGMSGAQSIVYNAASPGGWQLIGRTPLRLFDLMTAPHVAYKPGDLIWFVPIRADEWDRWTHTSLSTGTAP